MKPLSQLIITLSIGIAVLLQGPLSGQMPLGPEFTYQGKLDDGGNGANGLYDMQFRLYDAEVGGNLASDPFVANAVVVSDGLFTVSLNFGFLNGDALWLEVDVRVSGGGSWTTLSPRQALTAAPFAQYSLGPWLTNGDAISNTNAGFVGVGRSDPITPAEVFGLWKDTDSLAGMLIKTSGINGEPFYGYSSAGGIDAFHSYNGTTGDWHLVNGGSTRLTVRSDGFVGVGRSDPVTASEVFGVYNNTSSFGGMYVETDATGKPFYGYSAGGDVDAYHYYDGQTASWHLISNGNDALTVDQLGRVGVGTTSPQYELEVNGVVRATGFIVSGNHATYFRTSGDDFHIDNPFDADIVFLTGFGFSSPRLRITANGLVGVGSVDPMFKLHVDGSAGKPGGGSWSNASDRRLKKNIKDLDGALEQLMRLRSVKFEYIDPESINELDGPRIGLIAQEVEKVFPDWVDTRNDSYKTVTFRGFEALAIEALRELREEKDVQLEQIRAGIRKLQRENDDLRDRLERVETVLLNLNAR